MDIFISYRHKTGGIMAHLLESRLEGRGIDAFLDKTSIHNDDFMEKIRTQIEHCPNFLMVVTEDYFSKTTEGTDYVFEEIRLAEEMNKNIIGVCFDKNIVDKIKFDEEFKRYQTFNFFYYDLNFETPSIDTIIGSMRSIDNLSFSAEKQAIENDWYDSHDMTEEDWLWIKADQKVCWDYDVRMLKRLISEDIFKDRKELNICLYQCRNVGLYVKKYNEALKEYRKKYNVKINYYGFCYQQQKEFADKECGEGHFVSEAKKQNISRIDALKKLMKRNKVASFDLIDFTLYLKDLKYPQEKLEECIGLLNKQGAGVYIRELDDDMIIAYPDRNRVFSRILNYLIMDAGAGNRTLGRQIMRMLQEADCYKVYVSDEVVSTEQFKTMKQKARIFDAYFSYLRPELRQLAEDNKGIDEYRVAAEAFASEYADIRNTFKSSEFYFRTGYISAYGLYASDGEDRFEDDND